MENIPQNFRENLPDESKRMTTKAEVATLASSNGWNSEQQPLEEFCAQELEKMFRDALLERDKEASDSKVRTGVRELTQHLEQWNGDYVYSRSELPIGSLFYFAVTDHDAFQNQVRDFVQHKSGIGEW